MSIACRAFVAALTTATTVLSAQSASAAGRPGSKESMPGAARRRSCRQSVRRRPDARRDAGRVSARPGCGWSSTWSPTSSPGELRSQVTGARVARARPVTRGIAGRDGPARPPATRSATDRGRRAPTDAADAWPSAACRGSLRLVPAPIRRRPFGRSIFVRGVSHHRGGSSAAMTSNSEPRQSAESKWCDIGGAAKYLKLPLGQMQKWAAAGRLPRHSAGRHFRYHHDELDEWMSNGGTLHGLQPEGRT